MNYKSLVQLVTLNFGFEPQKCLNLVSSHLSNNIIIFVREKKHGEITLGGGIQGPALAIKTKTLQILSLFLKHPSHVDC